MKPCEHCKKPFKPERNTARFCSDACKHAQARGTPPVPFDMTEAQLILDVAAALYKMGFVHKDLARGKRLGDGEMERYYRIRDEAAAEIGEEIPDPAPDLSP